MSTKQPLLEIRNLDVSFRTQNDPLRIVHGLSLTLEQGETIGIVGESGSGKSVTSLAVMGLLPQPTGFISNGEILLDGRKISGLKEKEMRKLRGNEISMIFQEPMTSLNPVFTIGDQLSEPLKQHTKLSKKERKARIIEILKTVGIPRPEQIIHEYPHQLSGGMRQRIMISLAMLAEPKLLIADEPTTALDVTIQAQILDLIRRINKKKNTSVMLITHDLGVVAEICDKVAVMYAGEIVEYTDVRTLFDKPLHPYTQGLIASMPNMNERKGELHSIPGNVPRPTELPTGCHFSTRCTFAMDRCHKEAPPTISSGNNHTVSCWLHAIEQKEEPLEMEEENNVRHAITS
ncbi:peptide ABC transporter ATP-binding protein [Sporosarcina sp. P13]|uniref:ABC transporter ATP-binding protein n=1 Tax=Sporosarcina sp. P13 TaxID=2048263 RepID=UPI000C173AB8|nr:ABC transporter ATP-binding protein [Sporosarcina sp. P13]PIC63881.1 peptide ABC transporter ATP-binding protein [Sporosarcina sp. P13]